MHYAGLCYATVSRKPGAHYHAKATSQLVTRSSRHKPELYKAMGRTVGGQKFSGHANIKDHYQRASLKGDSRGKCFSLTHPASKFS